MQSAKGIAEVHINLTKTRVPVPLTCLAPAFRLLEIQKSCRTFIFPQRLIILLVKILSIEGIWKSLAFESRGSSSYSKE